MTDSNKASKANSKPADETLEDGSKRDFVVMSATGVAAVGAAAGAIPFVSSLAPSKDVLAVGSTEVDISNVKEGETITVMWRGSPIFIKHRTAEEIKAAEEVDMNELKDPEPDEKRVIKGKEQWLVAVGVCTHLGCVPLSGKGEYEGWFCPCHGSHYDSSARIRKGPAPKNLPVPEYAF